MQFSNAGVIYGIKYLIIEVVINIDIFEKKKIKNSICN